MVRNLSSTIVVVEAVEWSGVGARAVRDDAVGVSPSSREVGPFGPVLGKVERCPTESGHGGPDLAGMGIPAGSAGRGRGPSLGGHGVSCARSPFSNRGWVSFLEGGVAEPSYGGRPEVRPDVAHANGP
jgi:hypothetical protein